MEDRSTEMEQINCINFCEVLFTVYHNDKTFSKTFSYIKEVAHFNDCRRVYFGSSFCGQHIIHLTDDILQAFFSFCREKNLNVTLVIPTFSQRDLKIGKNKVRKLIEDNTDLIDEVTVNDYGMLMYIGEISSIKVNLGRLFMKDYRDPRFVDYFRLDWKPKIFTNYLVQLTRKYRITGLEFDPTHHAIDYSECPKGLEIGVHLPYCYVTVGRICEYASISKDIDKKYRPNLPCQVECKENLVEYHSENDREWVRLGRTIYFNNEAVQIKGVSTFRAIFFPLDVVKDIMIEVSKQKGEEMNESIGSI